MEDFFAILLRSAEYDVSIPEAADSRCAGDEVYTIHDWHETYHMTGTKTYHTSLFSILSLLRSNAGNVHEHSDIIQIKCEHVQREGHYFPLWL